MKKGLNKDKYLEENMNRKKGQIFIFLLVGFIIFLGFAFLYPYKESQILVISIGGDRQTTNVDFAGILSIDKPTIDIFSRSNPKGNLRIDLQVFSGEERIVNINLFNIGLGQSKFDIDGTFSSGDYTIITTVYEGNRLLDRDERQIQIQ